MRLIDADALLKTLLTDGRVAFFDGTRLGTNECLIKIGTVHGLIEEAPTVDAAPVRHGEWKLRHIGHGHYWECSECHTNPCIYVTENTNFCPNCGAKMKTDGGKQDAD